MAILTILDEFEQATAGTEGWFNRESAALWDTLLSFQKGAGTTGHFMEIGVHHGKSAAMTLLHSDPRGEMHFLVDMWLDRPRVEATLKNVRDPLGDLVRFMPMDSRAVGDLPLMSRGRGKLRWIHIDGEHTAAAVTNDLGIAATLIRKEGLVVVDDFLSWLYPQITEAVFRYLRDHPDHFRLLLCGYNKAYLAHPHHLHHYQDFCVASLVDELEARGHALALAKTTPPGESSALSVGPRFDGRRHRGPDWDPDTLRP